MGLISHIAVCAGTYTALTAVAFLLFSGLVVAIGLAICVFIAIHDALERM